MLDFPTFFGYYWPWNTVQIMESTVMPLFEASKRESVQKNYRLERCEHQKELPSSWRAVPVNDIDYRLNCCFSEVKTLKRYFSL